MLINYVTGANGLGSYATYAPDGSVASFKNGYAAGFAGISNSFSYNDRLQPVFIQASGPSATIFNIGYDFHLSNGNNGNVYQLTNNKDNTRSQIFAYDQLNRLTSGRTSASNAWGTNYTIDAWGNLTQKTIMSGMLSGENFVQASLNNNRITGFSYDAAGNTTSDGINSYTYNAENQIVSAAGITYTYDGGGDRVKKSSGRLYWYGTPGIIAETDQNGVLNAEYLFCNHKRIARRDYPSGAVHYYFSDKLTSTSVVASAAGNIEEEYDFRPWGEEKVFTHLLADQHYKFNGKERDSETGFDQFGARFYASAWSRWLTPDWSADPTPVPYAEMDNPQSLNLYSFVGNNPLTHFDPDGHCWPVSACAEAVMAAVNRGQAWVQQKGIATEKPAVAATATFISGVARDVINGVVSIGTMGSATGACMGGNGCSMGKTALAVVGDVVKAAAIAAPAVGAISGSGVATASEAVATGSRYVGSGEAALIEETGLIPNTNAAGALKPVFYTPESPMSSASAAQEAYQLPSTPTHVAELDATGVHNTYGGNVEGGNGIELITHDKIVVTKITKLDE